MLRISCIEPKPSIQTNSWVVITLMKWDFTLQNVFFKIHSSKTWFIDVLKKVGTSLNLTLVGQYLDKWYVQVSVPFTFFDVIQGRNLQ